MKFFKIVLATMVGWLLAQIVVAVIFFIFFVGVVATLSFGDIEKEIEANTILHLKMDFPIVERPQDNPFANFNPFTGEMDKSYSLRNVTNKIRAAAKDDNVKGIYIDGAFLLPSYATLEEIRNALLDFKASGKFIYAYSDVLTQKSYYLASIADSIFIHPQGLCEFNGFVLESMFLRGTFDKLDIKPNVFKAGKYKSAGEIFTEKQFSEANKQQLSELLNSLYGHFLSRISESRGITVDSLRSIAANVEVLFPSEAARHQLVTRVAYPDEARDQLKKLVGVEEEKDFKLVNFSEYLKTRDTEKKSSSDKVALIYAVGNIEMGEGDYETIGGSGMAKAIKKAREDDKIKAIVLRINSGGGSALASDLIWREVVLTKGVKPVVVSMGDVAASGGYYIACIADTIVAQPNTITGSIGVIGFIPTLKDFWENKLGITWDRVKTSQYADLGNPNRELMPMERRIIESMIDSIYDSFISHVAEGRNMSKERVYELAQGRVWTGAQAKENGLIDVLGGLDDAFAIAARMANIEKYSVRVLPELKNPVEEMLKTIGADSKEKLLKEELGAEYELYAQIKKMQAYRGLLMVMPHHIEIK